MVTVPQIFLPYAIMRDGKTLAETMADDPSFLLGPGNNLTCNEVTTKDRIIMPIYLQIIGIVFDLLKQIAWPVAAFFIALLFRNELRTLLPKLRRLGPTGLEFEGSGQQVRAGTASVPGDLKELPGFTRSNAIADLERRLHSELNSSDHKPEDREHVLIRLLAEAQLVAHFEQIYRIIFGSQISVLRELNAVGKISESLLYEFFKRARDQHAELYKGYA